MRQTLMALAIAALQIALALPAGYALAKLGFRGRGVAFGLVVATLLVPAQVRFVPVFALLAEARLVNTMTALVLPFGVSAFGSLQFFSRSSSGSIPAACARSSRLLSSGQATSGLP